jgi:hypothetical protein
MSTPLEYRDLAELAEQELARADVEANVSAAANHIARAQVYATLATARAIRVK